MMAATFPFNALPRGGLDNQSIAFFNTPGTPWLYSGVAISNASACRIAPQILDTLRYAGGFDISVVERQRIKLVRLDMQSGRCKFDGGSQ